MRIDKNFTSLENKYTPKERKEARKGITIKQLSYNCEIQRMTDTRANHIIDCITDDNKKYEHVLSAGW